MVGLQSGNSPLKFGKGGGGSKKELPTDNSFRVVPPVFVGVSASFVICLKKSCKCLMFKLGIWKFHFSFIYSNQSGTVKLFYLCFTPHPAEIP